VIAMLLALLAPLTAAADPGRASPADIAKASALYAQASEKAGGTYAERERRAEAVAAALTAYREALDLLGARAPAAERARLEELQRAFNREVGVLRAFAETALEDFDEVFSAAMARALPAGAKVCEGQIAAGPALPGMPGRTRENPDCTGVDRSAEVARAMDADPRLRSAVTQILALEWPAITLVPEPREPIGGARWIPVQPLLRGLAGARLKVIDRADEQARVPLAAALEEGFDKADAPALVEQGRAITERTARERAALAAPILAAIEGRASKLGAPDLGWCANPELLGGCAGTRASPDVERAIREDKKVRKAL
jgi:hypothetical protein